MCWIHGATAGAPARIASLNLCTDTMLFELVSPTRIASVTYLSRDPNLSPYNDLASELPANRGHAEEIIGLSPDLVVTDSTTLPFARRLLEQLGIAVATYAHANDFEQYRANLTHLAELTGTQTRAVELLAQMSATARTVSSEAPRALLYQPNGFVPGTASLMHTIMTEAGFHNIAFDRALTFGGFVPLEALLLDSPDILLLSRRESARPSLAEAQLEHPALRRWRARPTVKAPGLVVVPESLWTCAGHHNLEAVKRLELGN